MLSPEEVQRLLECVELPHHRTLLTTIYACGLRLAEATHLTVQDLDSARMQVIKDYADGSQQKVMRLSGEEFLRRFFQHLLPKGFVRIRSYGLLANRHRGKKLALCRKLLSHSGGEAWPDSPPQLPVAKHPDEATFEVRCRCCGGAMRVVDEFRGRLGVAPEGERRAWNSS